MMLSCCLSILVFAVTQNDFPAEFPAQELARDLKVGYAVITPDLNHDGRPDVVVVDSRRVLWFENQKGAKPGEITWRRREIIAAVTKPDNVCISAADIDGDGLLDLALGADWRPADTKTGGTLQWLKRAKSLDDPWSVFPIAEEPTLHRIRIADVLGDAKPELIVMPLMGNGSTRSANFADGRPVRTLAFSIPANPQTDRWPMTVLDQSTHVTHNFLPLPPDGTETSKILTASYEGVSQIDVPRERKAGTQEAIGTRMLLHPGNQQNPASNRGASEIKLGQYSSADPYIATIEPWHGNEVVVYQFKQSPRSMDLKSALQSKYQLTRQVIDDDLRWGHAVSCVDLNGDGRDELIVGVRDHVPDQPIGKGAPDSSKPSAERKEAAKRGRFGVRIYWPNANSRLATGWTRQLVEPGGVAVEDLAVSDFDLDGRPDIVAAGRATGNLKIYWNRPTSSK